MGGIISVCIPTFNRPDLLLEAVASCLRQKHRPLEILIGDDSEDDRTARALSSITAPPGIAIRYRRNGSTLGQSGNVNRLFDAAQGAYVTLLHDDDRFCDGGLDKLVAASRNHPSAVCIYGMQHVVGADGTTGDDQDEWNSTYYRKTELVGPQRSPLQSALWQQVPNDAYLIDTDLARRVRYRQESDVGHAVDADFVIQVAKVVERDQFIFVADFISEYRLTPVSLARSREINRRQDLFFDSLSADDRLHEELEARDVILQRIAVGAALDAAIAGRRRRALRIILSKYYDRPRFSRWTAYRLVCVFSSSAGLFLKRVITVHLRFF